MRLPRLSPSAKSSTPRRRAQRSGPTGGSVVETHRVAGFALISAAKAGHSSAVATSAVLNISPSAVHPRPYASGASAAVRRSFLAAPRSLDAAGVG